MSTSKLQAQAAAHTGYSFFYDFLGERVRAVMDANWWLPWTVVVLYMIMVLVIPKTFMKDRQPYNFVRFNQIWNLGLTIFSFVGAYYTVPAFINVNFLGTYTYYSRQSRAIVSRPSNPHHSLCVFETEAYYDGASGFFVCLFILSKIPEMIDTFFLVFQKKKIIFLHWYHHITVMLYCYHAYTTKISSGLIFATMNYCVHSVMYLYYYMCSIGLRKKVRPVAPFITMAQILQMVVGLLVQAYILYVKVVKGEKCDVPMDNALYGFFMYLSYFILFGHLYLSSYVWNKKK